MINSPIMIMVALHYWTTPGRYAAGTDHANAPSVLKVKQILLERKILQVKDDDYEAGPAMPCYVEALCSIPLPVQVWVVPDVAKAVDHGR